MPYQAQLARRSIFFITFAGSSLVSSKSICLRQSMVCFHQKISLKARASHGFHRTSHIISWRVPLTLERPFLPILPLIQAMMSFIFVTFGTVFQLGKTRSDLAIKLSLK